MARPRIITVTPNPALDVSTSVAALTPHDKLRCSQPRYEPGGGGINCARVVALLGGDARAIYSAGGPNGGLLADLLRAHDVEPTLVPAPGDTRLSFHVDVEDRDEQYRFVLPGTPLDRGADTALIESTVAAVELAGPGTWVIASGSLPPGGDPALYGRLASALGAAGARLVLDTAGPGLAPAADVGVGLLRNNLTELSSLVGADLGGPDDQDRAVLDLVERGAAGIVVTSLGAGGCVAADRGGVVRLLAPTVEVESTVGAGDSLTAGVTLALARGDDLTRAVCYGIAAGTAAVLTPRTELCRPADVERLHAETLALNGLA